MRYAFKIIRGKKIQTRDVDITGYAEELLCELEKIGAWDRIKNIQQLGGMKYPKKKAISRYDYVMIQIYLHNLIKKNMEKQMRASYGGGVPIYKDGTGKSPSVRDCLYLLVIAYNMGHFYNTFISSKAVVEYAEKNDSFRQKIINSISDADVKELAREYIRQKNYYRFHLINSYMILEHCDPSKTSVMLAKKILVDYMKDHTDDEKLAFVLDAFKTIRRIAYLAQDLPLTHSALYLDIGDEVGISVLFEELMAKNNDNTYMKGMFESINKLLDARVYNEYAYVLTAQKNTDKMVRRLKETEQGGMDYYSLFMNRDSILNRKTDQRTDFDKEVYLKITFSTAEREVAEYYYNSVKKTRFVRAGYYDRHNGDCTVIIALAKACDKKAQIAFEVMKKTISALRRITDKAEEKQKRLTRDKRYLLCAKFFLHYYLGNHYLHIQPTVHPEQCVICASGNRARVDELHKLLNGSMAKEATKHEVEFMIQRLQEDDRRDVAIMIPASIVVYEDKKASNSIRELDGMVIFPMRKEKQIMFLEAKDYKRNSGKAKKQLKATLDKLAISVNETEIERYGNDAAVKLSI